MTLNTLHHYLDIIMLNIIPCILCIMFMFFLKDKLKKRKKQKLHSLKKIGENKAHGIMFGKQRKKLVYSPENAPYHVGVFANTGAGKTSAIGIPTLRNWRGTSFTIDISGDISTNCPDMPNKLIYDVENPDTSPYNILGAIDDLKTIEEKNEALEQLAYLLMPEHSNMNDNARFFLVNGRKILTASLIAFYHEGMDFIDIAIKVVSNSWQALFDTIDKTDNPNAILYINSFLGASEQNTSGCKQSCDDALKLFATNEKIKRSIRRPRENEKAVESKKIENHNMFVIVPEDKLSLFAPLMNIVTSQIMKYISARVIARTSPVILLFLDEFGSLQLDAELCLDAVRRYRKRKCRIMMLMQNTIDLTILYGNDTMRAILSNLHYKVLLGGLGEPESQKYFADLIGYKTSIKKSTSKNSKSTTQTESETKEYKIEPADLDRQGKDTVIVISADEPNGFVKLKKNYYFKK